MKVVFFTLALDCIEWLPQQLSMMQRLACDWRWVVCEGVADNVADTGWCQKIEPRFSNDGTHEWLDDISSHHPNVTFISRKLWNGKTAQCNRALEEIKEPCLLWQLDADELWQPEQVHTMLEKFEHSPGYHWASFWADYLVGPNLHIVSRNTYGNNSAYEWRRVWRYQPHMRFSAHEPPILGVEYLPGFSHCETEHFVGAFLHCAYMLRKQVAFKEKYYGYAGAVEQWEALQKWNNFPVKASTFLKWIKDDAIVDRITK